MHHPSSGQLAEDIFANTIANSDLDGRLFPVLVNLLVRGSAVRPAELAAALDLSLDEINVWLDSSVNVERDSAGNIEGFGLTLRRTPHAFEVDGRKLYAWCALDTLIFPALLGRSALVTSRCAATGAPIRLRVTPDAVEDIAPAGTAVSLVVPQRSSDIRTSFCNLVHFFVSVDAAKDWLAANPGAQVLPVRDAYEVGKETSYLGSWRRRAMDPECCEVPVR